MNSHQRRKRRRRQIRQIQDWFQRAIGQRPRVVFQVAGVKYTEEDIIWKQRDPPVAQLIVPVEVNFSVDWTYVDDIKADLDEGVRLCLENAKA